jgi:anthranilate phosphoribosyltransferase
MSEIRAAINDLVEGNPITPTRLGAAMGEIMDGEATPATAAGLLIGLRMKGETVEEIVAVARALRARAASITPKDPKTIDTCGTGGSGLDTFNISTTSAFVVAGAGISVAKHGNRAASSQTGSFDVLEALGVRIDLPIEVYGQILAEIGIAPFFARTAHPAFRHVAPVRAELGVRTLLNCLGPLLSPVGARYQVVGVYSAELVEPLAAALAELGAIRALVVHGDDGLDELTTTGPSSERWSPMVASSPYASTPIR